MKYKMMTNPEFMEEETIERIYFSHFGADALLVKFKSGQCMKIYAWCNNDSDEIGFETALTKYDELCLGLITQWEFDEHNNLQKKLRERQKEDAEYLEYQKLKQKYDRS